MQQSDVSVNGELTPRFWLKIASFAFAAWAAMIPLGIWMIDNSLTGFAASAKENDSAHRVIDHRLDIVEERQTEVLRRLDAQDKHLAYQDDRLQNIERKR